MFSNYMTRTFVQTHEFSRRWKDLGFTDDDLRMLELMLMENPQAGPIMQGTGGLRKMRFAFHGRGKSGSARVCYVDYVVYKTVYLITAFSKEEKANLSKAERNNIKKAIQAIEKELKEHSYERQDRYE